MFGLLVKELEKPEVEAEAEEKDTQSDGEVVFSAEPFRVIWSQNL